MRRSRIPQHKTIEEFKFSWQPCINRQVIYARGTCEFIRKKENIAFIGLPGTGKTHLSIALGVKAIEQGYTVLFTTLSEMMEDLWLFVNSWGGIRMNPAPFLRLELLQWFNLLYAVLGMQNKPPYPDLFSYDVQ